MTVHALFFCLRPDPVTAAQLTAVSDTLVQRFGLREKPPRTERLHVTLHHLGWFDDADPIALADVRQRAESAAASLRDAPARVDFEEVLSFTRKPRNRPFVLSGGACLDEVRRLRAALGDELAAVGLPVDPHFTPHLTLLYDDLAVPSQPLPMPAPGWTARHLHLMDSLQGQSTHVELARWSLD